MKHAPSARSPGGQALAEFAIVFPVLVLILAAILQFGLIFSSQIGLTNSVREAARYGSVLGVLDSSSATAARTAVLSHLVGTGGTCGSTGLLARNVHPFACAGDDNSPGLGPTSFDAAYCRYGNTVNSDWSVRISVVVFYNHPLMLPIVGNIIDALDGGTPGSYRLGASEQMRVENRPDLKSQDVTTLPDCP
ncbi:MAG TPA: TadE family protein [Gemmatimonadales bacterium]